MKIRLVNPRGRIIEVDEKEAEQDKLLEKGFEIVGYETKGEYLPAKDNDMVANSVAMSDKPENILKTEII